MRSEALTSRKALYGILQAQYSYPLTRTKVEPFLRLESEHPGLEQELASLRRTLAVIEDWEEFIERLNIEYTRLFEGPGQAPAPPYASFYLNDQRLMGPETMAVRRKYIQCGVASLDMGRMPDDHIALELAFMSYLSGEASNSLARKEHDRSEALIREHTDFLRDHLLTWAPKFCSNMLCSTHEEFFAHLSRLTRACLEEDAGSRSG